MDHEAVASRLSRSQRRAVKVSFWPPNPGDIPPWVRVNTLRVLRREGLVRQDERQLTEDGFAVAAHLIESGDES